MLFTKLCSCLSSFVCVCVYVCVCKCVYDNNAKSQVQQMTETYVGSKDISQFAAEVMHNLSTVLQIFDCFLNC